jgi:hypothetical protein
MFTEEMSREKKTTKQKNREEQMIVNKRNEDR